MLKTAQEYFESASDHRTVILTLPHSRHAGCLDVQLLHCTLLGPVNHEGEHWSSETRNNWRRHLVLIKLNKSGTFCAIKRQKLIQNINTCVNSVLAVMQESIPVTTIISRTNHRPAVTAVIPKCSLKSTQLLSASLLPASDRHIKTQTPSKAEKQYPLPNKASVYVQ